MRLLAVVVLLVAAPALATESPLATRAKEICALFHDNPAGLEKLFTPAFLAKVPPARLHDITRALVGQHGKCTAVRVARADGLRRGELVMVLEKGFEARAQLVLDDSVPHLVNGLLIQPASPQLKSFAEVLARLEKLPGTTSLLVVPLGGGQPLAVRNPEKPLAVGSAFKLWILAELGRQLEAGSRKAEDTVALRGEWKSLPSGILQAWPTGAPVTLHTLATLMISHSDNTATDHLLMTLGRETVEKSLAGTGNRHPEGMRPFIATHEMFRLKLYSKPEVRARWNRARESGRRTLLAELGRDPLVPEKAAAFTNPLDIETIEWFASTGDLCRVMERLHKARSVRDLLAVNPGMALDKETWTFVGFKGGSEPGVMNMTYLLERKDGKAFCVAATWNDPKAILAEETLPGLVTAAISLIPE